MPYVLPTERVALEMTHQAETAGELNYLLSLVMLDYLDRHGLSYGTLNTIVGAVESAKDEFQERIVRPYERQAMIRNGDLPQFERWKGVIG